MISIYTTKDNLESICLDENKQAWLDMILKLGKVFVNEDEIYDESVDPDDDPFYTLYGMQIDINSSQKDYINNIQSNPVIVLQHPSGIFLLDIPLKFGYSVDVSYN